MVGRHLNWSGIGLRVAGSIPKAADARIRLISQGAGYLEGSTEGLEDEINSVAVMTELSFLHDVLVATLSGAGSLGPLGWYLGPKP